MILKKKMVIECFVRTQMVNATVAALVKGKMDNKKQP